MKDVFLWFFVVFPFLIFGQDIHFDQYTTDDGLPSNTIYEIIQDSTGLLWIGTENGLVSFDGLNFKRFSDPRLKDNDIIELELSKDGHVTFVNISNQYCRLEEEEVLIFTYDFNNNESYLNGLYDDLYSTCEYDFLFYKVADGKVSNRLLFFDQYLQDSNVDSVRFIYESLEDSLMVGIGNTLHRIVKSKDRFFAVNSHEKSKLLDDSMGNSLIKLQGGRILFCKENNVEVLDSLVVELAKRSKFSDIAYFEGLTYVGVEKGMVVINRTTLETRKLLESYKINKFYIDKENNLWISTNENGLLKTKFSAFKNYNFNHIPSYKRDIYHSEGLTGLISSDDVIVLDSVNNIIDVKVIGNEDGNSNLSSNSLVVAYDKDYSFIFSRDILYRFNDKGEIITGLKFVKNEVPAIAKAACIMGDKIFVASRQSVHLIPNQYDGVLDLSDYTLFNLRKIQCMTYDYKEEVLYLGTALGVYKFSNLSKLTEIKNFSGLNVTDIQIGNNSIKWFGTANNGIYSLNENGVLDSIDIDDGLASNLVFDIALNNEYLYVASNKGISRIDADNRDIEVFSEFEGLHSKHVNAMTFNSNGNLLVTQKNGFVIIESDDFGSNKMQYEIFVDEILCNNEIQELSDIEDYEFDYNHNKLDFKFNYVTLENIDKKAIRYRINDDTVFTYNSSLDLRLPSLSPGSYKLEVQGILTEYKFTRSKIINIKILPPWWKTIWAWLFSTLLMSLWVYIFLYRRSRRQRIEEEREREKLLEIEASKRIYMQQINKVKDQALQLQMNPHFIFNAMNAIQNFIISDREKEASDYLTKFAKLIRLIFEYSNSNLIRLENEIEFVQLYLELEMLRFKNRVSCELSLTKEVEEEKDLLRIPPLIIQPIIENSFKHGLFHMVGDGVLKINYGLDESTLVITVEDNGVGRKKSTNFNDRRNSGNKRYSALNNVKDRLALIADNNPDGENRMVVEDLFCDDKPCGTITTIKISIDENK